MAATRLGIYNGALLLLGERFLADLNEEREPRRLLDHVWNERGVQACLEEGQWYFAMRTVAIDYDPGIDPPYGLNYAFEKPSDWLITCALCSDEYFNVPLTRYSDETGYWYADEQTLYVRYVSNDSGYGQDLSKWPEKFTDFVKAHFAWSICNKLDVERVEKMEDIRKRALKAAKSNDAMAEPTKFPAPGSWSTSRQRYGSRRDRGNRGSLIG